MSVSIALEDPGQPEIVEFLEAGEAYAAALYPPESNHLLSIDDLRAENVRFAVARDTTDGSALGTGAIALYEGWAELKRMWVSPAARGRGLSKAILADLEARAKAAGIFILRLETGIDNFEALKLYERSGFLRCAPFADYKPDPLSVFMEKNLNEER